MRAIDITQRRDLYTSYNNSLLSSAWRIMTALQLGIDLAQGVRGF